MKSLDARAQPSPDPSASLDGGVFITSLLLAIPPSHCNFPATALFVSERLGHSGVSKL